ncbi:anti-sigma factor [Rhodococcus tibetensis]|uniref:Regulator of SigK n=1 Tax=Rhodococcus tibetensis TaxID=2965064 RepID=A0ABT1QGL5_9NOCA|nr:anti-sigma factor [Rhodococcus sp. FXJ9.536]MCQ4120250.1 anti-sigma factor [Rhodococcus sp. FXJ9.536]
MNDELLAMVYPYALDALDDHERRELDAQLAAADKDTRAAFAAETRAIRETFAVVSEVGAVAPPTRLRARLLGQLGQLGQGSPQDAHEPVSLDHHRSRRRRWQVAVAAAAAVGILAGGTVIARQLTQGPDPTVAEEVLQAQDLRSSSTPIPGGGSATANYSKSENAVVLVMNDVVPPAADSVYQMWLLPESGDAPVPAGTMTPDDVLPTTTVVLDDVGSMAKLAFTVEPPGGSPQPTSNPFAVLALS